ncbi:MAG: hypothetical protein NTW28_30455, partial [Candidatus Solibacter sp.]|nr:hypothetical protein [Candidatus Solibacter sp.]
GHVAFADGGVTINLRTLALTVALTGKQFVAGDYWLAEVRKNKHAAGAPKNAVLTGATPNGIVHHYLKLATVASGKLQVPTTKESQHLSFPKLTELDAGDVGYQAGASGFLDSTDDTVKKALDKLTGLPASSVPYTPLHPQPGSANHVFEATDDTVQKALDKVCGIQARNVRFTRPKQAENSIYQVAATPVDTVDEALKLLANLMAAHVKFEPKNCSILEKAATVQAALEDLCATLEKSLLDNSARLLLFRRGR